MKLLKEKAQKIKDTAKMYYELTVFPYGIDEQYDKDCDGAFHKFLDYLYYVLVSLFVVFGVFSTYFLITYGIYK